MFIIIFFRLLPFELAFFPIDADMFTESEQKKNNFSLLSRQLDFERMKKKSIKMK